MSFLANDSDLLNALDQFNQGQQNANTNFQFILPTLDVPTLLNNSKFIDTLGCSINSQNASCLDVCGNVQHAFADWPNFYTCSWYPTISESLATTNSTPSNLTSLTALGISGDQLEFSSNISSTLATCLADYCSSSTACLNLDFTNSCSIDSLLVGNGTSLGLNRTNVISCLQNSVCGTTSEVNPDIGGLGVLLALLIQYTISLFAIVFHFSFYYLYELSTIISKRKGQTPNSITQAKTALDKRLEALTSVLVEFQKAQCFFATTLQVASLIVLPGYLTASDARNSILLRLTAGNAFAPIILTLAHITYLSKRTSVYLLLLSSITFMIGSATFWLAEPFPTGTDIAMWYTPPTVPVMSCNNIAPFAPCFLANEFFVWGLWQKDRGVFYDKLPQKTGSAVWAISLGILLWLIGCVICGTKLVEPRLLELRKGVARRGRQMWLKLRSFKYTQKLLGYWERFPISGEIEKLCSSLLHIFGMKQLWDYAALGLGSLGVTLQFSSVIQVIMYSSNLIATEMGFGQIVAVGIWIPVLLEYAYLEIRGTEEGTKYRLRAPLVVTHQQPSGQSNGIIP